MTEGDRDRNETVEQQQHEATEGAGLSLVALAGNQEAPAQNRAAEKGNANANLDKILPGLSIDGNLPGQQQAQNRGETQPAALNPDLGAAHTARYGSPTIHAPELAGVRHNTTHFNSTDGVLSRGFENGSVITQHTQGENAGAQVLQDGSGRVTRIQEPAAAGGPNRPAREFEFQYPPGEAAQNRTPSAVVIRNAQTGQVMDTIRANENTSISAHPGGFTVNQSGERKAMQTQSTTNYNLSGTEINQTTVNGPGGPTTDTTMTQVVRENTVTADGITVPRGSTMSTHWNSDGSTYTNVQQPNGQSDSYTAAGANQARQWNGSTYASPTNLEFQVNGQNQSFAGIRSADRDKLNGNIHLHSDVGTYTLTLGQNGGFTNVEFKPFKTK